MLSKIRWRPILAVTTLISSEHPRIVSGSETVHLRVYPQYFGFNRLISGHGGYLTPL